MTTMTSFDRFTSKLQAALQDSIDTLTKRKAAIANESLKELGYAVRSKGDDIMKESIRHQYLERITKAHATACQESLELETDEAWWDDRDAQIKVWIVSDCMSVIFRGVSTSSNPMYMIEEMAKIEAHKGIISSFMGGFGYAEMMFSNEAIKDVFAGVARREAEEEAQRLKRATKILVYKTGGKYILTAVNYKGEVLSNRFTDITSKPVIKVEAEVWARQLQEENRATNPYAGYAISVDFK